MGEFLLLLLQVFYNINLKFSVFKSTLYEIPQTLLCISGKMLNLIASVKSQISPYPYLSDLNIIYPNICSKQA